VERRDASPPSVGVALNPPGTNPYLVVKQDNNGTTFVIASVELALPADEVEHRAHTPACLIGAWTHPISADIEAVPDSYDLDASRRVATVSGESQEPPF
jgi:hypothetical protein